MMAKKIDFKTQMKSNVTQTVTSGLISNEIIKQKIIVLNELKTLIQPLQEDEFEGLEKNIIENGCKDSLVIWQTNAKNINPDSVLDDERFVLIDGHNRYEICQIHHISFNIVLMFFASLQEAKNYMLDLQMGRRNLSQTQMAYYRGLRYNNEKITSKLDNFNRDVKDEKTSIKIAKQFNVDEKTIRRDGEFASGLEMLSPEFKQEILAGRKKISKKTVQQLVKLKIVFPIESVEDLDNIVNKTETIQQASSPGNQKISKEMYLQIQDALNKVYETNDIDEFNRLTDLIKNLGKLIIS